MTHRVVVDLQKFIDNLSHWYIRQSRSRFEKRAMDADKAAIFATLYETLMTLCQLCAPVIPFLAEEIYQNLAVNTQSQEKTSVHLINWPIARLEFLNENLIADMAIVMRLVSLGKAARMQAKLAAYQPLEAIDYFIPPDSQHQRIESLAEIIKKALNIKQVKFMDAGTLSDRSSDPGNVIISKGIYQAMLVTQLTPALIDEGVARQVFHRLNALRKQAGLGRDEHIRLYVKAAPGLLETIFRVRQQIAAEALVDETSEGSLPARGVLSQFKIHGETVVIGLEKID
jgi:isoleucyl-tRNA synthetase